MTEAANATAFQSGLDELGVFARLSVDPKVFSETAILKTAYWFTDQYYLFLMKNPITGLIDVELRLKQGDSLDLLKTACGEFLNNMLDQEVRQRVLGETSEVRDTLVKKAFFEARAALPEKVASNELSLPKLGQSYLDDPVRVGRQD